MKDMIFNPTHRGQGGISVKKSCAYVLMVPLLTFCILIFACGAPAYAEKIRVMIETDIGGDPDDQASFVRWLLYVNEWDVEGIITTRPPWSRQGHGYTIAKKNIDAYRQVVAKLKLHKKDYPTREYLMSRFVDGMPSSNAARDHIISVIDKADSRPLWYLNWGCDDGTESNLKRALDRVKSQRNNQQYLNIKNKLRVVAVLKQRHFVGHTEVLPFYLDTFYPDMDGGRWYHRWRPLTQTAGGFDINRDVLKNHGPLGALYTIQKEGDTPTFMFLLPVGLNPTQKPDWGSWAGRFGPRDRDFTGPAFWWANLRDIWNGSTHRDNTLKRWAVHLQNDFRARMDWCVSSFAQANHEPEPVVNGYSGRGLVNIEAAIGSVVTLSAAGSKDPDGDSLSYQWFHYQEPGTYRGNINLSNSTSGTAKLSVPGDLTNGDTIHVVLIVTDDGSPPLTRYRRIVITGKTGANPASAPRRLRIVQ
jgi:hypothetical protein